MSYGRLVTKKFASNADAIARGGRRNVLDWSASRLPPFKHQVEDTQALITHPWYFIASEMRTGKTKITIDAAQFLFLQDIIDRVIVVAPEPVRSVWAHPELGELAKHLWLCIPSQITEYCSNTVQWQWRATNNAPTPRPTLKWIISNYEFIRPYVDKKTRKPNLVHLTTLLKYCGPKTLLVFDESSAITSHKSQQFKSCLKLRKKCGRVVLLNGTPFDTPIHLFAQGNMLHTSVLQCPYITHFRARYARMGGFCVGAVKKIKDGKVTWEGGRPTQVLEWVNLEDLQRRFAPYTIRRLQKDCLDMVPEKLEPVTLTTRLTETTWTAYKAMRDDMVVQLTNGNASIAQQAITKLMRLSQITGGFLGGVEDTGLDDFDDDEMPVPLSKGGVDRALAKEARPAAPSVHELGREKLDVLISLVAMQLEKDPNFKVVVWVKYKPELMRMLAVIKKTFPQMLVAGIHGGQKKSRHATGVNDRQYAKSLLLPETAPAGPVFVGGTLGTGSFGLDFSAAHTSVNYSYDHSLRKFLQSGDRVYGPGQTHAVAYFDIVAVGPKGQKTYDSVIVQARRTKQDLATWTTDAWVRALTEE